jgi:CheY-like chemotaxis protein
MTTEMSAKNIVLYADDDLDDIQLVQDAFSQYAKNVDLVTVADGLEAVSYLTNLATDEPAPCLIILDINMPRMDGKEALVKIREMQRFQQIPAILFTTSSQPRDKEFATKYQSGFITKPIDVKQMDIIAGKFIEHCSDEIQREIRSHFKEQQ